MSTTSPIVIRALVNLLDEVSRGMRRRILEDRAIGGDPHEEVLTHELWRDIQKGLRGSSLPMRVWQVPRHQEANLLGADLAIWVADRQARYAGIHLQAKRQFPDDTYRDLNHANSRGLQVDTLLAGAKAANALAAYAFYNGLPDGEPSNTSCMSELLCADLHGVNVAPAQRLKAANLLDADRIARWKVESHCAPLGCLLRCGMERESWASIADALYAWGPAQDLRHVLEPGDAPEYLQALLELEPLNEEETFNSREYGTITAVVLLEEPE